ncbi:MAG: MBL fold metallo-hydrolase RNA specificity domain-containing protein, partial [Pseudomonadota bacterium]
VQGGRDERSRNAARFAFDVRALDAMVLSHAHIDHVGRLPLLSRRGYRGPVFTHRATADLARIMLEDAARLAMADAEHENRRRARRGQKRIEAPYDLDDVNRALRQLVPLEYGEEREILPGVRLVLHDAGHILGAAIVDVAGESNGRERRIVFSADIGPRDAPVMRDPTPIERADLVVMESTYGDRMHRSREDTVAELGAIFHRAHAEGGMVLVPAFAVGRSQEILYWMARHYEAWGLDGWRIALDSPMAARVVELYRRHLTLLDEEARSIWKGREPFQLPNLATTVEPAESQKLNELRGGAIIIAGSGMCNGGRIVHHLRHHLWRPSTHVVIAGYQAHGTLGRDLVERKRFVRIFGEQVRVAAQVHTIGGLSAHADQGGLLEWYGHFRDRPPVWLVHGEDKAREVLAEKLARRFGCKVGLAKPGGSADA